MKIKSNLVIILISLATATVCISGGYGYWQKDLTIKGDITVVKPVPIEIKPLVGQQVPLDPNSFPVVEEPVAQVEESVQPGQSGQPSKPEYTDKFDQLEPTQAKELENPVDLINDENPHDGENEDNDTNNQLQKSVGDGSNATN